MGNVTSLYEVKKQWLDVVSGLDRAQGALRKLGCEHQANCIADIQEAASAALGAVELRIETLNDMESKLLFAGTSAGAV